MILEIDMGNTRLKWRVRNGYENVAQGFIGIESAFEPLAAELESYRNLLTNVWVVSVVGDAIEQRLTNWSEAYVQLHPEFARSAAACGVVRNGYSDPQALGADRWLGLVAAHHSCDAACVVVSFGTAVTLDLVAKDGKHLGGYIAPGVNLMLNSLASGTRQVRLADKPVTSDLSPAKGTVDAIHSACDAMLVGLVNNGLQQLRNAVPPDELIEIIFTGGDAIRLSPFFPGAKLIPGLVLDGLAYILDGSQRLE